MARWRASGQTSEQFCAGQGFSAGVLRHWACRLGNRVRKRRTGSEIRLARVVRVARRKEPSPAVSETVTIEVGRARVSVGPGFSRTMLAGVIEVLAQVAEGGR